MGTKRAVPLQDKAKFFALIASGRNIKDACAETGVHYNTGSRWVKKAKELEASRKEATHRASSGAGSGGRQSVRTTTLWMLLICLLLFLTTSCVKML
jgi:hypothetical protein